MSEQTATTMAPRQFGDPVRIGRDIQQTQKHTSFLRTSGHASAWFVIVFLVNFIDFANGALLSHSVGMMFFMWSIVGGPLCGGIATGLTSRTRSMAAACLGFLVWVALQVLAFP